MNANKVDLNFKVDPPFRYNFRCLAAHHGMSGVALLRKAIQEWCERRDGPAPARLPTEGGSRG